MQTNKWEQMMKINDLLVTQSDLRNIPQIEQMVEHVLDGGYWTRQVLDEHAAKNGLRPCPLMKISRFPDGKHFIHDGHHRAMAVWLGDRDHLIPEEYNIFDWTYDDYLLFNAAEDWCTPFDPRIEVRFGNLAPFKAEYKRLCEISSPERAEDYILTNKHGYVHPRDLYTVAELCKRVGYVHRASSRELVYA